MIDPRDIALDVIGYWLTVLDDDDPRIPSLVYPLTGLASALWLAGDERILTRLPGM